jgi:hypothetical protein
MSQYDALAGGPSFDGAFLQRLRSKTAPGALALAAGLGFGFWMLYVRPVAPPSFGALRPAALPAAAPAPKASPFGELAALRPAPVAPAVFARHFAAQPASPVIARQAAGAADPFGALVNPGFQAGPQIPVLEAAIPPASLPLAHAPLPPVKPAELFAPTLAEAPLPPTRPAELARLTAEGEAAPSARDNRNILERLLGVGGTPAPAPPPAASVVAYAPPEPAISRALVNPTPEPSATPSHGLFGLGLAPANPAARYDGHTAVYDISAHRVYLPNGTQLEAHSGYGDMLDDPRHVDTRMRGATPPNVYELTPREELFHGVAALRMKPVGSGELYGRAGLLAHPYMLGPGGDSNGCVSFKDYDTFLQAYQSGLVKRLVVVAKAD